MNRSTRWHDALVTTRRSWHTFIRHKDFLQKWALTHTHRHLTRFLTQGPAHIHTSSSFLPRAWPLGCSPVLVAVIHGQTEKHSRLPRAGTPAPLHYIQGKNIPKHTAEHKSLCLNMRLAHYVTCTFSPELYSCFLSKSTWHEPFLLYCPWQSFHALKKTLSIYRRNTTRKPTKMCRCLLACIHNWQPTYIQPCTNPTVQAMAVVRYN